MGAISHMASSKQMLFQWLPLYLPHIWEVAQKVAPRVLLVHLCPMLGTDLGLVCGLMMLYLLGQIVLSVAFYCCPFVCLLRVFPGLAPLGRANCLVLLNILADPEALRGA